MEDELVVRTVKLKKAQINFIKQRSKNLSGYIRSLIDKEIGAQEARDAIKGREDNPSI